MASTHRTSSPSATRRARGANAPAGGRRGNAHCVGASLHSRRSFECQRNGGNNGDSGGAYGATTNDVIMSFSPSTTLDFPTSPSAFPSASPSAFPSASPSAFPSASPSAFPSASPSSSVWPHVFQIPPPVDSILWPSDVARFNTNGGESIPAFQCGSSAEGAAADVALGDWSNKAAASAAVETAPKPAASVEPRKANACGHTIPAPEEREVEVGEVQVGEVQVGEVLGRPVEDIRRQWLLLRREIGRGQYGVIRRCVHRSTGENAACKSIRKSAFQSAADVEAVRNEVAFMEELKGHANIIRIKQALEMNRHVHVVMEICEGGDLFDRIDSHGRLSEPSAARIFRSLMLALQHCHSHGIVHRVLPF
ncbi:unnamed protein product [Closterium sp. Naga37s-1]|nr:unnamed protein product [Closterium sp. Naga37s-1]